MGTLLRVLTVALLLASPAVAARDFLIAPEQGPVLPRVGMADDGSFVVTYSTRHKGFSVWAKRFTSTGEPQGNPIPVPWEGFPSQRYSDIHVEGDGSFTVVWMREAAIGYDVMLRRFDAQGVPLAPEFKVNQSEGGVAAAPSLARLTNGEDIVVWEKELPEDRRLLGRRVRGRTPVGDEFELNPYGDTPTVTAHPDGGFLGAWAESRTGSAPQPIIRRFSADGTPQAPAIQALATNNWFRAPSVNHQGVSVVLAAYEGRDLGPSYWALQIQAFDAKNTPLHGQPGFLGAAPVGLSVPRSDGTFLLNYSREDWRRDTWDATFAIYDPATNTKSGESLIRGFADTTDNWVMAIAINASDDWVSIWYRRDEAGKAEVYGTLPAVQVETKRTSFGRLRARFGP